MSVIDNGGANAIKGFNYQKSVIVLIAVQNYVKDENLQIYVEAEDDVVVTTKGKTTCIQVKSAPLSIKAITNRPDGKDSILEKNHNSGDERCFYKLITPSFTSANSNLQQVQPRLIHDGAVEYEYTEDGKEAIQKVLKTLSSVKLKNSRVALTAFRANQKDASLHVIGVMNENKILVDNHNGRAALDEFIRQIDQKSEIKIKTDEDKTKKLFTSKNLSTIFTHANKKQFFDEIMSRLGYTVYKQMLMQKHRINIGALYSSFHKDVCDYLCTLDLSDLKEDEIISLCSEAVNFDEIQDDTIKETIVIDAYSQIIFKGSLV